MILSCIQKRDNRPANPLSILLFRRTIFFEHRELRVWVIQACKIVILDALQVASILVLIRIFFALTWWIIW